ncbi:hypothetical protein ACFWWM_26225 [Streptomyces sp. NPDC058682]|uniref:hypothetical protein n=1 Tax=unclassified Streptomyces TaxID=2593676 RepID=UPI00225A9C6B|nr:hypothetical protein [Streptomyces sp. NBC_01214]MCX4804021.1 hypothetical protein [Streptomyces sp. NBC_01214]
MPSPCDSKHAAVGDVGAALMMIDSRLKAIYAGKAGTDPEQQQLIDQFTASLGPEEAEDLVDGACTLIYMFVQWLRMAHEDQDSDVIEYVVPSFVASLRMMPKSVRPEVIPTMVGLVVAAATGLSPNLWRKQYGDWTGDEMNSLEATALLLAEHINRLTGDHDFATRMVTEALSRSNQD